jgi:hypothetical protein
METTNMSRHHAPAFLTLPAVLALSACGGPKHIGQITPVVAQRLSGAWVLNVDESDDVQDVMRRRGEEGGAPPRGGDRGGARRPGGGGGFPGGMGGRGGMPSGEGMRRPSGARRMSPEAMRALRELAQTTPTRIDIALTDSLVTMTYAGRPAWVLPFGKTVEHELSDDVKLEGKAEWVEERLVVTRRVAGGGGVSETFMPSVDGTRLTIDVDLSGGPGGGIEFQRVYNHPKAESGEAGGAGG